MAETDDISRYLNRRAPTRIVYDGETGRRGRAEWIGDDFATEATCDLDRLAEILAGVSPAALIATPTGQRPARDIRRGDRVVARDAGQAVVTRSLRLTFGWRDIGLLPILAPRRIQAGALGAGLPVSDLVLSGGQRIVAAQRGAPSGTASDTCPVDAIAEMAGIGVDRHLHEAQYQLIVLEREDMLLVEGVWCASCPAALIAGPR
ncbi:MAG: Hint domain-containing protein [Rhodobacteraceae bacterium]|nr:Hint domain-containing protein [Paracoccaceae bacterium]